MDKIRRPWKGFHFNGGLGCDPIAGPHLPQTKGFLKYLTHWMWSKKLVAAQGTLVGFSL